MSDTIAGVMQTEFPTFDPAMPIRQAAGLLHASGHEAAAVVDSTGALIGILTQKDCFRPAVEASYYQQWRGTVAEQMSSPVTCIEAETDIVAAARMFQSQPFRAFPVTRAGRLVGLLRREDVLGRLLTLG